jgi:hypothetical protein
MINKDKLLNEMRESVGNEDPVVFFKKMVDVFDHLFSKIEKLENECKKAKLNAALAINWDPKIAAHLIEKQLEFLRSSEDKDIYVEEIKKLKEAYKYATFTDAKSFADFWQDTLGYHPFLDYE